jgi:hypothetical protein
MDSQLRTPGMTALNRTFYEPVNNNRLVKKNCLATKGTKVTEKSLIYEGFNFVHSMPSLENSDFLRLPQN